MKLFTFRQASRRSWRINQKAPRVEVYILYYRDTMQNKMVKLMANKLAVAGIIEGNLSDEGLSALAESEDLMAVMAKELANGIKDNVEDIGNMFKKMAFLKPERESNKTEKGATNAEPVVPLVSSTANKSSRVAGRTNTANYPFVQPKGESRSLLERSEVSVMETWAKRKKVKVEAVLEGQCSMFDGMSA